MGQIILDKIPSTAHIESVVGATNFKNGQFLELGKLEDDGETRLATAATSEVTAEVFLADAPIDYGYPDFNIANWELVAGKVGRAYHLGKGDVISVTNDLVADVDNVAIGSFLTIGEGGLGFKATAEGARGIAKLIGKENQGFIGDTCVIAIL